MSKQDDIEDLLGDTTEAKPAKKAAVKKTEAKAEVKAPAAKKAVKADPVAKVEAKAAPSKKAPINFEEGERQALADAVTSHFKRSKKSINSRDLAAKLETETRKLRVVLYTLVGKGVVALESGASKTAGMTVSPA